MRSADIAARRLSFYGDGLFRAASLGSALVVLVTLAGILCAMLYGGWPALREFGFGFLVSSDWDIGRERFGALVAIVGVLFMAPQTDEFWTKVGLLSGLVAVSAIRPLIERVVPEPGSERDSLRWLAGRLLPGF